ncbi:ATP-binding cassette domain-containing protein [Mycoplasma sp. Pen4]|nr:ATP-binding cassette domain-containing protein [Mycoplasma sp. Pen4]
MKFKDNKYKIKELQKQFKNELKQETQKFIQDFSKENKDKFTDERAFNKQLTKEKKIFIYNYTQASETKKEIDRLKFTEAKVMKTSKYSLFKKNSPKPIRKRIGIVFQFAEYQLFKGTIKEDIAFGPIAFGVEKEKAYKIAEEVLEMVGLPPEYLNRSPFELSGGQKRRVAIAGILAMQPDFLVVDEPTAGLDPVGVKEILEILNNLNKQGKTIINVTHDLDNVLKYSKRIVLFKKGTIVKDGDPYEILNDVDFLKENNLQPPQLLEFVNKLRKNNIPVPKVLSEDELVVFLNQYRKEKGGN